MNNAENWKAQPFLEGKAPDCEDNQGTEGRLQLPSLAKEITGFQDLVCSDRETVLAPAALAAPTRVQVGVRLPPGVTLTWAGRGQLPSPHWAVWRGRERPPPHLPCSNSSKGRFLFHASHFELPHKHWSKFAYRRHSQRDYKYSLCILQRGIGWKQVQSCCRLLSLAFQLLQCWNSQSHLRDLGAYVPLISMETKG